MKIERIWAMPNQWTFTIAPIKKLLAVHVSGDWVDPFCGLHSPATLRNDLNPNIPANSNIDALKFLQNLPSSKFDGALFDPPYSITQAKVCYDNFGGEKLAISPTNMKYWASIKNELARIVKTNGKVICFGWSSQGIGINRGFEMMEILLVPHGGSKNDTIVTVEIKKGLDIDLTPGTPE